MAVKAASVFVAEVDRRGASSAQGLLLDAKENSMRKINKASWDQDILDEYDFSKLTRVPRKYAGRPVCHSFTIELVRHNKNSWLAAVPACGAEVSAGTREEAVSKVQGLVLEILGRRIQEGKSVVGPATISFIVSR